MATQTAAMGWVDARQRQPGMEQDRPLPSGIALFQRLAFDVR